MHTMQEFPLVQDISAKASAYRGLYRNGEPLRFFVIKRLREYPVTGGPSCFCKSIWDDRLLIMHPSLKKLN